MSSLPENKALKLRAVDGEDLAVVSAILQDAVVRVGDLTFLDTERTFALIANRFCWEACPKGRNQSAEPENYQRVNAGLSFSKIKNVRLRGIDRRRPGRLMSLLAITEERLPHGGAINLIFSEAAAIRLEVDEISCHLKDLDLPWPACGRPHHPED